MNILESIKSSVANQGDGVFLRAEFERRLKTDPTFAADAQARLEFFYRRHSAWDERYGLYPVLRLEQAPPSRR